MIIGQRSELVILDTNIARTDDSVPVWDNTLTYLVTDQVQVTGGRRKYKATQAVPADINPIIDVNPTTGIGTYWYDYEAVNYYKAFDELGSSQCINLDQIYYQFQTSDVDMLLIENIVATSIRAVVTNVDDGVVIQDVTTDISTREVYDWFDWTYSPTEYSNSFFLLLKMAYNTTLDVYIDNLGFDTKAGHIVFGRSVRVGLTLADPKPTVSSRGLTAKSRDEFGNIVTRRKARFKRMTINCLIDSNAVDIVESRLEKMVDMPLIIVGDDSEGGQKSLSIFGEIKDHDMPIGVSKTQYQLEVDGYI